jgi:metal-sulfur cluster biosynthetic enzyme
MDGVSSPPQSALPKAELDRITDDLVAQFKTVFDPEIKVDINDESFVDIEMTLTAPGCPVAGEMPGWVEEAARKVKGVTGAKVNLVFDPPWTPARMSDEAKLELNML